MQIQKKKERKIAKKRCKTYLTWLLDLETSINVFKFNLMLYDQDSWIFF